MGFLKQPEAPNLFEDEEDRKEPEFLIDSDIEQEIREKAKEKGKSPGQEFRDALRRGL